jgi:hypothetical protein
MSRGNVFYNVSIKVLTIRLARLTHPSLSLFLLPSNQFETTTLRG